MDVKLLITYDPAHLESSREKAENLFKEINVKPEFLKSKYSGIFLVNVPEPKEIVKKLKKILKKDRDLFGRTHRYIPIDRWVKSTVPDMQKAIKSLVPGIKKDEKWMMDLEKRYYNKLDFKELIMKLTDVVDREKIDLKKPEKIIKVEIVGDNAGISVLKPDEILVVP
ncbi:MAG: THUMP domain-containing protein [Candidatus Humimicrobiaceae bacterium]|jgi:tRNA(Ser,Leu) C12 N-acetylase TAN1|nr:THUMP domain-containing protein [Actinomycetota bacterium]MDY0027437.1 THUMP domain-containing protein [Candidatus Humimicrobiaceae bacterium]